MHKRKIETNRNIEYLSDENEKEEASNNWMNWCRLCANYDPQSKHYIYSNDKSDDLVDINLANAITKYFHVNVKTNDELPKTLCTECFALVVSFVKYAERIENVQKMFTVLSHQCPDGSKYDYYSLRQKYGLLEEDEEMPEQLTKIENSTDLTLDNECVYITESVEALNESDNDSEYIDYNEIDINDDDIENASILDDKDKLKNENRMLNDDDDDGGYDDVIDNCTSPQKLSSDEGSMKGMIRKNDKFPCTKCNRIFRTKNLLKRHSTMHIPLEARKTAGCPYCDKKFTYKNVVKRHILLSHIDKRPFKCKECDYRAHHQYSLKNHMLTHTSNTPFKCDECGKSFKSINRLKNHQYIHKQSKQICPECGKQLKSVETMKRHRLVHSNEMPFKCEVCGRAFKLSRSLKVHLILHTGLHPYSCRFCERTFTSNSNCRGHMRQAHPDELALYDADINGKKHCGNVPTIADLKELTKNKANLLAVASKCRTFERTKKEKEVKTIVEGLKKYDCEICGKKLTTQYRLDKHMKTHKKSSTKRR